MLRMLTILWEFTVPAERRSDFEQVYNSTGAWAQLFAKAEGYGGTTLLRDPAIPGRYLTLDRWRAIEDFDRFKQRFAAEYKALDHQCEALTSDERLIGRFEEV